MKPDKLMIGDWVYNTHHKENICITPYDFFVHGHDEHGYQHLNCSCKPCFGRDLEPIPLTEEFFEKNGFELVEPCDNFPYIVYDSKDKRIQVSDLTNNGEEYWSVHVDNEDFDTIGSCDVKYVHQFQQLLRLCGYKMDVVV